MLGRIDDCTYNKQNGGVGKGFCDLLVLTFYKEALGSHSVVSNFERTLPPNSSAKAY
jgi:hypothetical protein